MNTTHHACSFTIRSKKWYSGVLSAINGTVELVCSVRLAFLLSPCYVRISHSDRPMVRRNLENPTCRAEAHRAVVHGLEENVEKGPNFVK